MENNKNGIKTRRQKPHTDIGRRFSTSREMEVSKNAKKENAKDVTSFKKAGDSTRSNPVTVRRRNQEKRRREVEQRGNKEKQQGRRNLTKPQT